MQNSALKTTRSDQTEPVLRSIFQKAELDFRKVEEMFELLGWAGLPAELKFEIQDDVKGYIDELEGRYSTSCPLVQRRRERVDFWINSLMDGICTSDTAIEALRIKKLEG